MNKVCTRCSIDKSLCDFSGHPKAKDGKQSQCKDCFAERARLKRVGRPCEGCKLPMDPAVRKSKKRCDSCMAKCTVCNSADRLLNQRICAQCQKESDTVRKSSDEFKFAQRITKIASKYKVRRELAASLAVSTQCEACDRFFIRKGDQHVDHCHATGHVRGILCFNCNAALGHLKDDLTRIEKLMDYLKRKEGFLHKTDLEKAKHFIELLIALETK